MQADLPTARGAQLLETYTAAFARRSLVATFHLDELAVVGPDTAYALTHSVGRITMPDGARTVGYRREMFVFHREAGAWKIARYLFNHDVDPTTDER